MIVERLEALAFGPLEGEAIDFAPGMNLIVGPNEAAKSTLHAALYAALCGLRRARGQPRKEDREFQRAHEPWDSDEWRVRIVIRLEDGRRIELDHDLANPGRSTARDLVTGHNVASEIVHEGSPDASRWLGLTRRSFLATACVRQAQLLAVTTDPDRLREELQRAAATAGRDETAAAAIARITSFHREHVGLDRANVRRPLRQAIDAVGRRREELERAQAEQARVLQLLREADDAEHEARDCDRRVQAMEAALAEIRARDAEQRLARIAELTERHPAAPPPLAENQELANRVAAVLGRWRTLPAEPDLTGPSSEELRARLAALPEQPSEHTEIHESVRTARDELAGLRARLAALGARPPGPEQDPIPADDDELRRLCDALLAPVPTLDPAVEERYALAQARLEQASRKPSRLLIAVGSALLVAGIPLLLLLSLLAGVAALAAGSGVLAWAIASARGGAERLAALEEVRAAENELGMRRYETEAGTRRRAGAVERCAELGIAADAHAVEQLLAGRAAAAAAAERRARWQEEQDDLLLGIAETEARLRDALVDRGVPEIAAVGDMLAAYEKACRARRDQASQAARRPELKAALAAREKAEDVARARAETTTELLALAAEVVVPTTDPAVAEAALLEWQVEQTSGLEAHQVALEEWRELQTLLEGRTVAELADDTARLRSRADELGAAVEPRLLADALTLPDPEPELQTRRGARDGSQGVAAKKRAEANSAAAAAPSVPEAEEALAAAEEELRRVRSLEESLTTARQYLEQAQERVHRDIAPVIAGTVARWLPSVTAGRYSDVIVDPERLEVQVRAEGGSWRDASVLSHGTREQIYLLLRLALSEHLVTGGERTPLLFDEVTAHCDASRRQALLSLLHDLSAERQIIVFSHEEPVREWAERALTAERDALFVREAVATP